MKRILAALMALWALLGISTHPASATTIADNKGYSYAIDQSPDLASVINDPVSVVSEQGIGISAAVHDEPVDYFDYDHTATTISDDPVRAARAPDDYIGRQHRGLDGYLDLNFAVASNGSGAVRRNYLGETSMYSGMSGAWEVAEPDRYWSPGAAPTDNRLLYFESSGHGAGGTIAT